MTFKQMCRVIGRMFRYLAPHKMILTGAFTLTIIATLARISQAKFVGYIMGFMSKEKGESMLSYQDGNSPFLTLNLICLAFLGAMIILGISTYYMKFWTDKCCALAKRDMREDLFDKMQWLSVSYFDSMRSGDLVSRASNDLNAALELYNGVSDFLRNLLTIVVCFAMMFWRDWQMTLVVLVVTPITAMAISKFGKAMGDRYKKLQANFADLSAIQIESIEAQKIVKAYTLENHEIERFSRSNEDNFNAAMKIVQLKSLQSPAIELLGIIGIIVIVWFGATRILLEQVTFAQMSEYWALMVMTGAPFTVVGNFYSQCHASAAAANRIFEVVDTIPENKEQTDSQSVPSLQGDIVFENVTFAYKEGKPVLNGINLHLKPGQVTAIVGTNGAGKSTLVNMVPGFYKPSAGHLRLDGIDIRDCDLNSLRRQISMVFQDSILFQTSIMENIRCGNLEADDETVIEAAKLANAHEFIEKLPDGYDTNVGQRGSQLSGGQRQRIAIARALVRNPRLLILDEYTSGIDAESEILITDAIDQAMQNRTCLVIAHRLNTIRHADRILVMDAGRIVEDGTHEELLAQGGLYKTIHEAQLQMGAKS